jgi:hypothetical protein
MIPSVRNECVQGLESSAQPILSVEEKSVEEKGRNV